jgi:hypothetical protein
MNAQRTDIDAFGNSLTFLSQDGIVIQSNSVSNGIASASGYVYNVGYEGFNILLGELEEDSTYVVSFDFQTTSGEWSARDYWIYGYRIYSSECTSYPTYGKESAKYDMWVQMPQDLEKHSHVIQFVALNTSMYLVFTFGNYVDSRNNYFEITNLKVSKLG